MVLSGRNKYTGNYPGLVICDTIECYIVKEGIAMVGAASSKSSSDHNTNKRKKVSFYIAQYPVRWTAQSASHFLPSLTDLFIPTPFSASPGSILNC